jgi:hypothetical protein
LAQGISPKRARIEEEGGGGRVDEGERMDLELPSFAEARPTANPPLRKTGTLVQ